MCNLCQLEMVDCDRDENGDVIDPISLEPVHMDRLMTIIQNGKTFCFDIASLANYVRVSGKYINPSTRQRLPDQVIEALDQYNKEQSIRMTVTSLFSRTGVAVDLYPDSLVGDAVIDALRVYGKLPDVVKTPIRVVTEESISLSTIDPNTPVVDILGEWKGLIVLPDNGYTPNPTGERYYQWYKYAKDRHKDWILNYIPERYQREPPKLVPPNPYTYTLSDRFLDGIRSTDSEPLVADGLKRIIGDTFISASDAHRLRAKLGERFQNPNIHNIILSAVVDRYNLNRQDNTERQYYDDRWSIPERFQQRDAPAAALPAMNRVAVQPSEQEESEEYEEEESEEYEEEEEESLDL